MNTKVHASAHLTGETTRRDSVRAGAGTKIQSIVTHRNIVASMEQVWNSLQFYEETDRKPPFLLRLLLPQPERRATTAAVEGEATTLQYENGHYARRITKLEPPRRYEFEVIDQRLPKDRGVMLLSGAFNLHELAATQTDLSITTRYASRVRPRWLAERLEGLLCRQLHRHLLDSIEARSSSP